MRDDPVFESFAVLITEDLDAEQFRAKVIQLLRTYADREKGLGEESLPGISGRTWGLAIFLAMMAGLSRSEMEVNMALSIRQLDGWLRGAAQPRPTVRAALAGVLADVLEEKEGTPTFE